MRSSLSRERHLSRTLALACLTLTPACGGTSNAPRFEITSPGSGPANTLPLLPIQVGYVGALIDRTDTAVVDGAVDSDAGPVFRAVSLADGYVQYYLKTSDGVFAAGNSDTGPLAHPVLVAPATVRSGMTWDVSGDDGSVILHFTATSSKDPQGNPSWTVVAQPVGAGSGTLSADPKIYVEGRGIFAGLTTQLALLDEQPVAKLPQRPVVMVDLEVPTSAQTGAGRLSMIRPPGGRAILTSSGDVGEIGSQPSSTCLITDGKTLSDGEVLNGTPFLATKQLVCAHAGNSDTDEHGTATSQSLATEQGASAFVAADGTIYYFPRHPNGSPIGADQAIVGSGFTGIFFLPGDKGVPEVVLNGCLGPCETTRGVMTRLPFDQLFSQSTGTRLPVPWERLGEIAEITPIRDDEGGTSLLLRTQDGMLWSSEVGGPAHVGARLPGLLSVQASVGGNEVLRVVGDGAVDRLHVSHGELSLEHVADVALPPGERAESAFIWHDPAGDRLLLFSTLYDGIALGAHGRAHLSQDPLPSDAGPMLTITPALQVQQASAGSSKLGGTDMVVCGAEGAATPAATGWTVGGKATPAFPQPGTPCVLTLDLQAAIDLDVGGEIVGELPGVGHVASSLAQVRVNGLSTETEFLRLGTAIFDALSRPVVAPLSGDGFVTRYERLGPGGTLVDPPNVTALDDGVADRAGNGLWVATAAGLVLVGHDEKTIAGSAGLFPLLAVVGGGVAAGPMQTGGSLTMMVSPSGAITPLPSLAADHTPIEVLADGTICGSVIDAQTSVESVFCQPPSGPEKVAAYPPFAFTSQALTMVSLPDGALFIQRLDTGVMEPYLADPATMTITDLGDSPLTITDANGDSHTVYLETVDVTYAPDGSAWATTRCYSGGPYDILVQLDRTGLHPVELDHSPGAFWQALKVSDHLILGSRGGMDDTASFWRLPRK